jgi:predicted negative regulator of RcsB-dependent stress response
MGTLVVVLLLAVAGWIVWKLWKKPDMNNDGVVDAKDVVAAAKEVAVEAKAEAKEVAVKAAEKVKKARAKKAK